MQRSGLGGVASELRLSIGAHSCCLAFLRSLFRRDDWQVTSGMVYGINSRPSTFLARRAPSAVCCSIRQGNPR